KYSESTPGADATKLDLETANEILNPKTEEGAPEEVTKATAEVTIDWGENDEDFNTEAPKAKVTVYVATNDDAEGWGYYCYYFYWNRHNDNLKSGEMGRMEFATVRNNVYKLSVTKIGQLGHPRNPKNDPDPVIPEDPDEDPTHYIQVQVEVLPWVVRVNNIEF
ncbi:MAG: Mfa1 fimbrilin C-terminal domain-containing protein, partial [Alistipes sp.]|nr:Mfa1 fimbrilin C-terminal domain-containing protein [Alistipes sp.]